MFIESYDEFVSELSRRHYASVLFKNSHEAFALFLELAINSDAKVTMTTLDSGSIQVYASLTN